VILLTSLANPEDVFKGLECGADNFITKPYEENNLLARIHYLLANVHLRTREKMQISMEVFFAGQKHVITSSRTQILNLLLSTYEAAVQKNRELVQARDSLAQMNGQLEEKVMERTVSLTEEIAEHKRAIEKIEEQAALLDKAQDAITVRNLEGRILFWNKGAERMYGWARQEVLGRNIDELLYADAKKFEEASTNTLNTSEWSGELQSLTKDRRKLIIEARWTLVRDNDGRPKSVLAINTDITERKKIEAQFMRAQRMESIGTMAGGIAHDLNNILTPIMLSIETLKTKASDPQAKDILEMIEMSAIRGSDIVRQMLLFARGMEGERIEVQLEHLIKDLENMIGDTFPKTIQLQFSVSHDCGIILADPTQIHQVLLNLCVNARDAMPNGGTLTVNMENHFIDKEFSEADSQAKAGLYVAISVTDSGMGIPEDILDKIFDPFFTTKEVGKGTGLGLSTVMAIVKNHKGFINVCSEPNRGTTFNVYLPIAKTPCEKGEQPGVAINLPRGNGETILAVDDESPILTITSQTLKTFGYRVLTATDGAEAVAIYMQHRNEISVVLTDMMMPVMDGAATIQAMRKINPAVKIIATSGLTANGDAVKASEIGIKHFLPKPYTAGTLLKTLRAILSNP
jgi:PAS domain S-box-containing protein